MSTANFVLLALCLLAGCWVLVLTAARLVSAWGAPAAWTLLLTVAQLPLLAAVLALLGGGYPDAARAAVGGAILAALPFVLQRGRGVARRSAAGAVSVAAILLLAAAAGAVSGDTLPVAVPPLVELGLPERLLGVAAGMACAAGTQLALRRSPQLGLSRAGRATVLLLGTLTVTAPAVMLASLWLPEPLLAI